MGKEYRLSAGAILYGVLRLGKDGIFGVPPVMPDPESEEFPEFSQEVETELMEAGYGDMDFDGEFALDEDLAGVLGRCADCGEAVSVNLKEDGGWRAVTLFPQAAMALEREEDLCVLRAVEDAGAAVLELLQLPGTEEGSLSEAAVDTGVLEDRDMDAMEAAGCSGEMTDLIFDALNGAGHYAHLVLLNGEEYLDELFLFYGEAGILQAAVEYTEEEELMRFVPLTASEAVIRVMEIMREGEE